MSTEDALFGGAIPRLYETHLVPLIFTPYAADLARRVAEHEPRRVLEIAAGTGVVSRALAEALSDDVTIVATDISQAMLDRGRMLGARRTIEWRQADAQALPFPDASFDVLVCQFGVMFFPDRPRAFAEFRRVLRPGGTLFFNVWDRIEDNEFADVIASAIAAQFPDDPPRFLAHAPHGYHERTAIEHDLRKGGWHEPPVFETVRARSRAASAQEAAIAYCQGTPLRDEIEARDARRLDAVTTAAARAIAQRFGDGPIDGRLQAKVISIVRQ